MSQILYVAVIYFCVGKNCAMISDRFPYETKDKCSTELTVREKDLRNHLTATIETPEEKKAREESEMLSRIEREKKLKLLRENKKIGKNSPDSSIQNSITDDLEKLNPQDDFQVLSAINYLNALKIFKNF